MQRFALKNTIFATCYKSDYFVCMYYIFSITKRIKIKTKVNYYVDKEKCNWLLSCTRERVPVCCRDNEEEKVFTFCSNLKGTFYSISF